jgi:hypothetical protein
MQSLVSGKSKRKSRSRKITAKSILIFIGVLLLAYLPLSSLLFSLKNDAFNYYFPSRYFISETLHSKTFPWWNPYINFGIPQYGDINSGFWNPITWFVALVFSYNVYSFSFELLFYLLLAGIGMFQLCRSYKFTKTVSYISGVSLMCSGFMVSHLQHFNWISGAAFLPWCLWGYHQLINKYSLKNILLAAMLFYFFFSSASKGLIIGSLYFFTSYIFFYFYYTKNQIGTELSASSYFRRNAWMLLCLLIFCLGLIVAYNNVTPHVKSITGLGSIQNPFSIQSIISLLLPFSTTKGSNFFLTDLSMRNMYFGLLLLLFFIPALLSKKNLFQLYFIFIGLFFIILSFGGLLKYITGNILPLVGSVKSSGEFLIFAIMSFILFSSYALNEFIALKKPFTLLHKKTYFIIQLVLLLAFIVGILGVFISHKGIIFHINEINSNSGFSGKLKSIVNNLSFFDTLMIQAVLQLYFLDKIKKYFIKNDYKNLIRISFTELTIATLLNIPFTGVGQALAKEVQIILERAPQGISAPFLLPMDQVNSNQFETDTYLLGKWPFYSKQLGTINYVYYPLELNSAKNIYVKNKSVFSNKPYLFTTGNDTTTKISKIYYKANLVDMIVNTSHKDTLVLQQSIYPFWRCTINGETKKPIPYKGIFNAVELA